MARTPATNPKPNHANMRMNDLHKSQPKPPSQGDSALPHPTQLPYDTGDFDCMKAGEYEDGCGEGADYD